MVRVAVVLKAGGFVIDKCVVCLKCINEWREETYTCSKTTAIP